MVDPNTSDLEIKKGPGDAENIAKRVSFGMLPLPQSRLVIWVNIALSLVIAMIGFGVIGEGLLSAQQVILFGIVTVALLFLLLNYVAIIFEDRAAAWREKPKLRLRIEDCACVHCGETTLMTTLRWPRFSLSSLADGVY